jgi:hypothetical protein
MIECAHCDLSILGYGVALRQTRTPRRPVAGGARMKPIQYARALARALRRFSARRSSSDRPPQTPAS